jgi:hypothetical protein
MKEGQGTREIKGPGARLAPLAQPNKELRSAKQHVPGLVRRRQWSTSTSRTVWLEDLQIQDLTKSTKDKLLMPVADIEAVQVSKILRCLELRIPVVVSLAKST